MKIPKNESLSLLWTERGNPWEVVVRIAANPIKLRRQRELPHALGTYRRLLHLLAERELSVGVD